MGNDGRWGKRSAGKVESGAVDAFRISAAAVINGSGPPREVAVVVV